MIFLRTISMHVANELNFESCYILYHNLMPIIIGKFVQLLHMSKSFRELEGIDLF